MPSQSPSAWQGVVEGCPWLRSLLRFPFLLRNTELPTFFPEQEASYAPGPDPHLHKHLGTPVTVHHHSRLSDRLPARFQPWHGHVTTPASLLKGFGAAHTLTPYPPGSPVPECLCSPPQDGQQTPQPQLTSSTLPPTSKSCISCFLTTHQ